MTNKTVSAIDHIITNSIFSNEFKTAISDHFAITYAFKLRNSMNSENYRKNRYFYKRIINENSKAVLKYNFAKLLGTQSKISTTPRVIYKIYRKHYADL